MRPTLFAFALSAMSLSCGGGGDKTVDAPTLHDAAPDAHHDARPDSPADAAHDNLTLDLAGGANGLFWDAASSTLFLTNNDTDTLLKYTDAHGLETVATLPTSTAGISLGGIVKRADGSILVANFGAAQGSGTADGRLFQVSGTTSTALTGEDANRRRIGLAQDSNGVLYVSYFVGGMGNFTGGVSSVVVSGGSATETEVATSTVDHPLKKMIGLVATPSALFISDGAQKAIFKLAVPGFAVTQVGSGALPSADALVMLPDGDLLTGGGSAITRVTQAGSASQLLAGFSKVEGLAYDPAGHRLFFIDHSTAAGTPDRLHVVPLAE